jgi:RNA polymerase sigma factor (TIGR02999 family)
MQTPSTHDVTLLLARVRSGDESAKPALLELAYQELRAIAGNLFKDQPRDHTLQPTALVNEVCLKLLGTGDSNWNDRKHFVRAAACAMRNLLTDHARAKRAQIRGGGAATVSLRTGSEPAGPAPVDLVALDDTLAKLSTLDARLGHLFELRFLAGLSVAHTADLLSVSTRTVELDTQFVRAWLQKELSR